MKLNFRNDNKMYGIYCIEIVYGLMIFRLNKSLFIMYNNFLCYYLSV
jgi:hypothetical protein